MRNSTLVYQICGVLAVAMAAPVQAQVQPAPVPAAASDAAAEGEIVVTARKREERLEDVPLSISVVSAAAIDRANLDNVSDLAMQTPGFSYKQGFGRIGGGGGAGVRPSIRGMSSVVGAPNAAFFIDGIFVSDNIASYQLDNLERVEVIKGPQSALFGRQTFSGAVNYVTRRPTNVLTGRAKVTIASFGNREVSAYLSGPLIADKLLFEINGRHFEFGGDYINADNGKRDLGQQKSQSVGGRLLFKPSPNFEAIASVGYSVDRDKGYIYGPQGSARNNCFAVPLTTSIPFPRTNTSRRGFYCGEVSILPSYAYNSDELEAAGFGGLNREFLRTSLAMTARTDSGFSITSVTALNRNDSIVGQDNTLVASVNPSFSVDQNTSKDFSQEIRLQTPSDRRIRALGGVYYYREDSGEGFQFTNTNRTRRPYDSADGVRSKAVFGMVEGDVTKQLTVSAEARYQWEKILGSTEVYGVEGAAAPAPTGLRTARFKAFLPRFTARYELSNRFNVYATAAKGNKPGGFNNFPGDASAADIQSFTASGFDVFDEESAWSYELGAKGRVFNAVNFSVATFYTDWKSQQLSRGEAYTRLNGTPNSVVFIQNAGESRIKGFEADLSGNPARWLFLRAAYTYVNAKFKNFYDDTTEEIFDTDGQPHFRTDGTLNPLDIDGPTGDVAGNRLPQTPTHQAVFTAQLTLPAGRNLEFFTRGDLAYESKRFTQVDNLNWAGDTWMLNGSIGIEHRNWTISLFGRNLLGDRTPLAVTRVLDFNRLLSRINPLTGVRQTTFYRDFFVTAPRRRQLGMTLQARF